MSRHSTAASSTEGGTSPSGSGSCCGRKVGLLHFLLVSHSFTGLIFARPDDAPPIQLAGCCGGCCICLCCGKGRRLSVRHRLFIFFFTLVATFFITLETTLGLASTWWAIFITVFLIVPMTCWLKGSLPNTSQWLNSWQPEAWRPYTPRVEEVALFLWLLVAVISAIIQASGSQVLEVVRNFFIGLAIANLVEVIILLFLYCPCYYCCPCIVPDSYGDSLNHYNSSRAHQGGARGGAAV